MSKAVATQLVELDLSDVQRRVGQEVGGGQLIEPCTATDIRRWVLAMDNFNPIHWDQDFAVAARFGGIVAPQSIAVGLDYGHGGPTLFSRGDTLHFSQHGDIVFKERATSIRYLAAEAERRGALNQTAGRAPRRTNEQLASIEGFVRYSNTQFRGPAYEGDITYLGAEVIEREEQSSWGAPRVRLDLQTTNQDGGVLATGKVDVELPL